MSTDGTEVRYADDARRYRLDSRIATGGMGEVWRATDTVLGRTVALKLLKLEYADDATFRARFETEARHAASLHHPGIAAVYDFGQAEEGGIHPRPWLVMELVEGRPLSDLIRPGAPMDPDAMRDLLAQVGDSLGAAHRAGIVHRDIKPANLLVTPDRRIKVTDFGIARAAEGMALTQTGQVMGTPQYLSPEQAEGGQATPASDVYSLGVVAYECLVGRRPFEAETPVATALAHLRQPVPPLPDRIPADLASVVLRALAKDPKDRFADGAAFAAALRDPATYAVPLAPGGGPTTGATTVLPGAAGAAGAAGAGDPATSVLPATGALPTGQQDPVGTGAGAGGTGGARRDPGRGGGNTWLWVVAVLLVLLLGGLTWWLVAGGGDPADEPDPAPSTTASPSPTDDESDEPETVEVDDSDYVGRDVEDVARELGRLGLRVVRDPQDNPGDETPGQVTAVAPSGSLEVGDRVTVTFWGPRPEPDPTPTPTPTPTPDEPSPTPTPTPDEPSPTPTPTPTPDDPTATEDPGSADETESSDP